MNLKMHNTVMIVILLLLNAQIEYSKLNGTRNNKRKQVFAKYTVLRHKHCSKI